MARSAVPAPPTTTDENQPAGTLSHPEGTTLAGEAAAARDTRMAVIPVASGDGTATGMYRVVTGGDAARVYLPDTRCDCSQSRRGGPCRHLRRVVIERNEHGLPGRGERVAGYYEKRLRPLRQAFRREAREVGTSAGGRRRHPAVGDAVERSRALARAVEDAVAAFEDGQRVV